MYEKFRFSTTFLSEPEAGLKTILRQSFSANLSEQSLTNNVGTFLIIALFFLWLCIFFLNKYYKALLILTTFLIFVTSSSFPWKYLKNTPLKMIQFPCRLVLFCSLFLIILI